MMFLPSRVGQVTIAGYEVVTVGSDDAQVLQNRGLAHTVPKDERDVDVVALIVALVWLLSEFNPPDQSVTHLPFVKLMLDGCFNGCEVGVRGQVAWVPPKVETCIPLTIERAVWHKVGLGLGVVLVRSRGVHGCSWFGKLQSEVWGRLPTALMSMSPGEGCYGAHTSHGILTRRTGQTCLCHRGRDVRRGCEVRLGSASLLNLP